MAPFRRTDFLKLSFFYMQDLGGLPISNSPDEVWKWLDINFLISICGDDVHPILLDLQFLINFRFIMSTFTIYHVKQNNKDCPTFPIAKVRIYGIPNDINGSRYLTEWRSSRPKNAAIDRNLRYSWPRLLQYLDFSELSWQTPGDKIIPLKKFLNTKSLLLLDVKCVSSSRDDVSQNFNFYVHRWTLNQHYYEEEANMLKNESFGNRVQNIYNKIQSPELSQYENKVMKVPPKSGSVPTSEEVLVKLIQNAKHGVTSIEGVTSMLYPFQIRSIAKMYEKESFTKKSLVPTFVQIPSIFKPNTFYYFDFQTYLLFEKPEVFTLPKGGILAENMGLGKTLISLSLICLTKYDISRIPDDLLLHDSNEEPELEEVTMDESGNFISTTPKPVQKVQSLVNLCKEVVNQNSLPWKYYSKDLPQSVINILSDDPGYFRIRLVDKQYESSFSLRTRSPSVRRKLFEEELPKEGNIYRTLFLSNTTLIIVPDNLFQQWISELRKHIDSEFLNKLLISSHFKHPSNTSNAIYTNELPMDPKELIKFDLIILTHAFFARKIGDLSVEENPLNKVYWKRLIIDEGHSMNSKSSKTSELCKTLVTERRWAVTGTPTTGLTKLHMDEEENENKVLSSPKKKNKYVVKSQFNEKADLMKLGNIIGNFLKIEPFHSQPKSWTKNIVNPLTSNLYGADTGLINLLDSIVVRHNLSDVESDLKLPQLHHDVVFLQPSFHNKISVNLFTAVLAVNAVSSERTDIDYMFHPANRQQLRRLITNLQRATFHWTGFKQEDIETLISICNNSLKKRKPDGKSVYNDYDFSLLSRSLEVAKIALENTRWRTSALLHEMNYFVTGLPDIFANYFATGVVDNVGVDGHRASLGVYGAPHLNAIQEFFYKHRFLDINDQEKLKEKLSEQSKPFWDKYWKDSVRKSSSKFNKQDSNKDFEVSVKGGAIANALNVPDLVKDFTPEIMQPPSVSLMQKTKKSLDSSPGSKSKVNYSEGLISVDTLHSDDTDTVDKSIREATILGTASAKLSYLGARLLDHQKQGIKSLVFFEFEDSAYYLTELLDVIGVNYILYATFINSVERGRNLSLFTGHNSEEEEGITLIMDLRLAAHGLTIISATRVYFISPVWNRSVEAQAIKRAHRIGQTEDVYVETLVLRDTLEEQIYRKRFDNKQEETEEKTTNETKNLIDDNGMREYILKHEFLPYDPAEPEYSPFHAPELSEKTMSQSIYDQLELHNWGYNLGYPSVSSKEGWSYQLHWILSCYHHD
ncbi:DNA-dependent ATPase of the nucleotide excision repair factor 4 complex [Scheffersomyces coipomensis]|uniref:DNA-dependent ATPase of the nucleotide excision repair factor 4 complex n=1 Tax=Scheffersomyces coipomensis TaxID=1788519 RepID=UPI00315C74F0